MRSCFCVLTRSARKSRKKSVANKSGKKERESHKFTHYFLLAKICFIVKDKLRKIRVFGLEFLNCRCHFFPCSRFTQKTQYCRGMLVVRIFSFVCLYVPILFLLPSPPFQSFDAYVLLTMILAYKRIPFIISFIQANTFHIIVYTIEMLLQLAARTLASICFVLFFSLSFASRSFDGITMYIVYCKKYSLNATINNCCNELKTFVFVSAFVSLCHGRRGRRIHLILSIILSCNSKCKKGGTECLSIYICQCHNRRGNKRLHDEYSKQWRATITINRMMFVILDTLRAHLSCIYIFPFHPRCLLFKLIPIKSQIHCCVCNKPKMYTTIHTVENGRYI